MKKIEVNKYLEPKTVKIDKRVKILHMYVIRNPLNPNGKGLWQVWLNIGGKEYLVDIDYESSSGNQVNDFEIRDNELYLGTRSYTWSNWHRLYFMLIDDKYYLSILSQKIKFEVYEV